MNNEETPPTRGERRERKRRSQRKMRVTGSSVRLLLELARRRAEKLKGRGKESSHV